MFSNYLKSCCCAFGSVTSREHKEYRKLAKGYKGKRVKCFINRFEAQINSIAGSMLWKRFDRQLHLPMLLKWYAKTLGCEYLCVMFAANNQVTDGLR